MSANKTSLKNDFREKFEDVVISGMSGRFPECDNVEEFKEKLYLEEDLVTEDNRRWPPGIRFRNFFLKYSLRFEYKQDIYNFDLSQFSPKFDRHQF